MHLKKIAFDNSYNHENNYTALKIYASCLFISRSEWKKNSRNFYEKVLNICIFHMTVIHLATNSAAIRKVSKPYDYEYDYG